jgi:hypothetical protein
MIRREEKDVNDGIMMKHSTCHNHIINWQEVTVTEKHSSLMW